MLDRHRFELSKVLPTDVAEEDRVGDSGATAAPPVPAVKEEDVATDQVTATATSPGGFPADDRNRSSIGRHLRLARRSCP